MSDSFQLFTSLRYDPALLDVPALGLAYAGWNCENPSPLYMLDYHRDRMLRAATHWGWDQTIRILAGEQGLRELSESVSKAVAESNTKDTPLRVKLTISKEGVLGTEVSGAAGRSLSSLFPERLPAPGEEVGTSERLPSRDLEFEVVPDRQETGRSEFTHFKTTRREVYDGARQRAGISVQDKKEVLLINHVDGTIMEGSITTPYLWRDGRWVTPPVAPRFSSGEGCGGNDGTTRRWALER